MVIEQIPSARWLTARFSVPVLGVLLSLAVIAARGEAGTNRLSQLREGPGVSNHPVNVIPSRSVSVPANWPLAPDGSITCTTCHQSLPALNETGHPRLRGVEETLDTQAFCTNCHRNDASRTAAAMHWRAMPGAHMLSENNGSAARDLDRAARSCLECHDGVSASDAGHETSRTRSLGFVGDPSRNHPIGVPYPRSGTRGVAVPLKPVAQLPRIVTLPRGQVGCISCHNLYNHEPNHLAVPIEGSRLCLTCHDMD